VPTVSIRGASYHYADAGAGPAVVLAHGFFFDHRVYDAQVAALLPRYRCVAFDWRGQGRSEVTSSGYDVESLTDDAAALIEALELAPCHFVATSMSGFVALRLAIRRPELVRSLVLLSSSCRGEPRSRLPAQIVLGLGVRLLGPKPFVGAMTSALLSRAFLNGDERAEARDAWRQRFAAVDRVGIHRTLRGIVTHPGDVCDRLGDVRAPALVVAGRDDKVFGPAVARPLAEALHAELHVLPDAAHCPAIEQPDRVTELIASFFERVGS
jgi:3-oxoadipate enol-lactonase